MPDIEGMKGREINYIPDRLIADPVVFRGMTDTEVVAIVVIGIIFWVPVSILFLLPFGYGLFGVGVGVGMAILTLLFAGKRLTNLKRKQPDGLHVVFFKKWLQKKGFGSYGFIDKSKKWDVRRSKQVTAVKIVQEDEDS